MQRKINFISSKMFRPGDCDNRLEPEQRLAPNRVRILDSSTLRRMPICTGSEADPRRVRIRARRKRTVRSNVLHLQCKDFLRHQMFPMVDFERGRGGNIFCHAPSLHVLLLLGWLLSNSPRFAAHVENNFLVTTERRN